MDASTNLSSAWDKWMVESLFGSPAFRRTVGEWQQENNRKQGYDPYNSAGLRIHANASPPADD